MGGNIWVKNVSQKINFFYFGFSDIIDIISITATSTVNYSL